MFSLGLSMCTTNADKKSEVPATAGDSLVAENNKKIVLRVYADLVNRHNISLVDSFYHVSIIDHAAFEGQQQGIAGFRKAVNDMFALFSEVQVTVDDVIAGADVVATHETWNATGAKGNKKVTGKTMHIFRFENGKITDEWSKGWEWLNDL